MSSILIILFVIAVVVLVVIFFRLHKRKLKIPEQTITSIVGGLGSGKTLIAVGLSRVRLAKMRRRYFFESHYPTKFFLKPKFSCRPEYFSNIPVIVSKSIFFKRNKTHFAYKERIKGRLRFRTIIKPLSELDRRSKYFFFRYCEMSKPLEESYLLELKLLPKHCVILIDELGSFASQHMFNLPNAKKNLVDFFRLYRHYTEGGYIYATDQSLDEMIVYIRRRINTAIELLEHKSYLGTFYKITCHKISTRDNVQNEIVNPENPEIANTASLLYGFYPRWKSYDSYCYSVRYKISYFDEITLTDIKFIDLKTHHVITLPTTTYLPLLDDFHLELKKDL